MSEIFERILKEKQDEIDRLKKSEQYNIESWERYNKRYEELALAAFMALDNESPECHFHLKKILISQGWCITCECNPCECEGQYDR